MNLQNAVLQIELRKKQIKFHVKMKKIFHQTHLQTLIKSSFLYITNKQLNIKVIIKKFEN